MPPLSLGRIFTDTKDLTLGLLPATFGLFRGGAGDHLWLPLWVLPVPLVSWIIGAEPWMHPKTDPLTPEVKSCRPVCKRETLVACHLWSSTLVLENHGYIAELGIWFP